jgi:hypothetical protein
MDDLHEAKIMIVLLPFLYFNNSIGMTADVGLFSTAKTPKAQRFSAHSATRRLKKMDG